MDYEETSVARQLCSERSCSAVLLDYNVSRPSTRTANQIRGIDVDKDSILEYNFPQPFDNDPSSVSSGRFVGLARN